MTRKENNAPSKKRQSSKSLGFWERLQYTLIGWLFWLIFTLLFKTCRITVLGQEIEKRWLTSHPGKGLLYASWHRGIFFFVYFYRYLNFVVMASASRDGELAAQGTRRFGWIPVRGSSTYRGSEALREMESYFNRGYRGGLVVDAPRGPAHSAKMGIIVLAKRTGLPIIPVMWAADRNWRISSWDRSIIPKPFSRIVFMYDDDFLEVPPDADETQCEALRQELDNRLLALMDKADHYFTQ